MIKFRNQEIELEIKVEGYAYPFSREYWDANWLSISVAIKNKLGEIKQKNDPALLTTELIELKEWLKNLNNKGDSSSIHFMEPCISFVYENNSLNILLKYGLNPNYEEDFDSEYKLTFDLKNKAIDDAINQIEKYMKEFPERVFPR